MAVDRSIHVELSSPEVKDFLKSGMPSYQSPIDIDYLVKKKLKHSGDRPTPPGVSNTSVSAYLFLQRNYNIYENGIYNGKPRSIYIGKVSTTVTVKFSLVIRYIATLLILEALEPSKAALISSAFGSFNPSSDGSIEEFITKHASVNGISEKDFELIFRYELVLMGPPILDLAQDEQITKMYTQTEQFSLVYVGEDWIDSPNIPPNKNVLPIRPGEDPQQAVDNALAQDRERLQGQGCEALRTINRRIIRLPIPSLVELKKENECHWEENDCFKTRVCLDVPYSKETYPVLYATLIYSADQDGIVNILEHCLQDAAIAGIVVGAVSQNLPAAIATFQGLFLACLKSHALELFACMVPDLKLVSEEGDWHRVF
ncbi:hypothetical protein [Agrobacterium sp. CG674]